MNDQLKVIKRSGETTPIDLDKIHKMVEDSHVRTLQVYLNPLSK